MTEETTHIPKLRFPEFGGEWKKNSLDEIASVSRGKFSARPRNDPRYYGGNIPFVQTGDIVSAKRFLSQHSQTLNNEGLAVSKIFPKGTILITIAANIGDVAITKYDVACPDSLVAIIPNIDYDTNFILDALSLKKLSLIHI